MFIGEKDKNGNDIHLGDRVRFKFQGQHYFTQIVKRYKGGFSPFINISVEFGIGGVDPSKCEIVEFERN